MIWSKLKLGDLCFKVTDGSHNPPKGIEQSEYLMLSSKNVFDDEITLNNPRYLSKDDFEKENKRTDVCTGDVLLTIVGTVGRAAVVTSDLPKFTLQRSVAVFKPNVELITSRFLMFSLQNILDTLMEGARGVAQKGIYLKTLREIEINIPPIKEQKRIAAILEKADAIRRKRQQAIDLTDQLLRSVFLDMFGDPVTNPKGIKTAKMSEIGGIITGSSPSRAKPEYYGDHIEWIKSGNINTPNHYLTKAKEFLSKEGLLVGRSVPENSLLVTCIAGSKDCIGNVAIANRTVSFNQQINAIVPNEKISTLFLYAQLAFNKVLVQRASTESMKGMVSKSKFSEIVILLPTISDQKKYVNFFNKTLNEIKIMEYSSTQSVDLFNSLTQQAFNGQLSKPTQAA